MAGLCVRVVPGETANIKITTPEDLRVLATPAPLPVPCTGFGYDVHAYGGNRPMVLGGMPIAGAPFVKAHSDGDVLLHALCDAILGCLGLGDIGEHFPDSDDRFENISPAILLSEVMDKARGRGCASPTSISRSSPRSRVWPRTRRPSAATWPGSWNLPTNRSTSRPPPRSTSDSPAARKESRPWPWSRGQGRGHDQLQDRRPWVTRFAPSPTGVLHLGNVRTAILNYLLARQSGGKFLLRLEDTDQERSTFAAEAAILWSLSWLGLAPDEPVRHQSLRLDLYRKAVDSLLAQDQAYPCFCTDAELELDRKEAAANNLPPRYSGRCARSCPQLSAPSDWSVAMPTRSASACLQRPRSASRTSSRARSLSRREPSAISCCFAPTAGQATTWPWSSMTRTWASTWCCAARTI
jgi:hypothetical protein